MIVSAAAAQEDNCEYDYPTAIIAATKKVFSHMSLPPFISFII